MGYLNPAMNDSVRFVRKLAFWRPTQKSNSSLSLVRLEAIVFYKICVRKQKSERDMRAASCANACRTEKGPPYLFISWMIFSINCYTGRFRPKAVRFSGFRCIKGQGFHELKYMKG